jgi:hypothetical protein
MGIIYSPLLLITAFLETRAAHQVVHNRHHGEADDDTVQEWEEFEAEERERDFDGNNWKGRVESAKPNIEDDLAVVEVRALREEVEALKEMVGNLGKGKEKDDREEEGGG